MWTITAVSGIALYHAKYFAGRHFANPGKCFTDSSAEEVASQKHGLFILFGFLGLLNMFYLWCVLSREPSASMFLNKASVGSGLLFVSGGPCWCQQAAPWGLQELWRCAWKCSVNWREALVCLGLRRELVCGSL